MKLKGIVLRKIGAIHTAAVRVVKDRLRTAVYLSLQGSQNDTRQNMQTIQKLESLTKSQEELLRRVKDSTPVPISDFSNRVEDIQKLLAKGHLQLKIIVYSWGLDFELAAKSHDVNRGIEKAHFDM